MVHTNFEREGHCQMDFLPAELIYVFILYLHGPRFFEQMLEKLNFLR